MDSSGLDTPMYSIAAVTRQTGVPAVTLRAWERRYGFPSPSRARGGRRLYTERDIWTVRELRTQTGQGVPISRAIALLRDAAQPTRDPEGDDRLSSDGRRDGQAPPLVSFERQLLEALLDLAPARADAVLSEALSQLSIEDVCLRLMQPTLNEIGRLWHLGQATVAQEHFASGVVRARLGSLLHHALAYAQQPEILAACPPDEWHELGLLMVCLFLARRGHSVRYLGANLPAEDLADAVRQVAPRLVVLSAQTDATAERLIDVMLSLRRLPPPWPALAYGGSAFNARYELRRRARGTFLGADASTAVATIQALLQRSSNGRPVTPHK